jgi:hypothetical protein
MSPVSSASGTNSAGETGPRPGASQRSSEVDDGLVDEVQLVVFDGPAEEMFELQTLGHALTHPVVEQQPASRICPLGDIHGSVRIAQEGLGAVGRRRGNGDPHTGSGVSGNAAQQDRVRADRGNPSCQGTDIKRRVGVVDQDPELVTA